MGPKSDRVMLVQIRAVDGGNRGFFLFLAKKKSSISPIITTRVFEQSVLYHFWSLWRNQDTEKHSNLLFEKKIMLLCLFSTDIHIEQKK